MIENHRMMRTGNNCQEAEASTETHAKGKVYSIEKKGIIWFAIIGLILIFYAIKPSRYQHDNDNIFDQSTRHQVFAIDGSSDGLNKCDLKWRHEKVKVEVYERESNFNKLASLDVTSFKFTRRSPSKLVNDSPIFKQDRDRFIIPILDGGPNNQLFELRETIFLAIKLNRTLVIPRFFKHFTDRFDSLLYAYGR